MSTPLPVLATAAVPSGTSAVLPPLYARWMDAALAAPIAEEETATCSDCVMCKPKREAGGRELPPDFNAEVKCCTFMPELHNFLVGAVLDDPAQHPQGLASVHARIDARSAVTPLGLGRTKAFNAAYTTDTGDHFGRDASLRCPHYLAEGGGRCGVWRHRESTCATWFCKHDRGALGKEFWWLLHELLFKIESNLAWWCVLKLDAGLDSLRILATSYAGKVRGEQKSSDPTEVVQRALWGEWYGREREFYREAARLVEGLTWEEVVAICGPEVPVHVRLVRDAHARVGSEELPERLRPGRYVMTPLDGTYTRVATYSKHDALDLPTGLLNILHHFDGRPTSEVMARLLEEKRIRLEPMLVRRLADFNILLPDEDRASELAPTPALPPR